MPPWRILRLRCRLMSPTPIYDLLRGERINAEVPAADVGPPLIEHGRKHRLPVDALTAVAGFDEPPGAVADPAAGGSSKLARD